MAYFRPSDPLGDDPELVKVCTLTQEWGPMEWGLTGSISNFPIPFTYMLAALLPVVNAYASLSYKLHSEHGA